MLEIKPAKISEAEQLALLLCRSIIELCTLDHGEDSEIIQMWTSNKSSSNLKKWLALPHFHFFVAKTDNQIVGVSCVSEDGEIVLNYVSPDFRFTGVSDALLLKMENKIRRLGFKIGTLTSTKTAYQFYITRGWRKGGPETCTNGIFGQPLVKYFTSGVFPST